MGTELQKLSRPDKITLQDCEVRIEKGLKSFYQVGCALAIVRDSKLWKEYGSFEEYCSKRWGFKQNFAYKTIAAAAVVDNICTIVQNPQLNESVARELSRLPDEKQGAALQLAINTHGEHPTAKQVKEVVQNMLPPKKATAERKASEKKQSEPIEPEEADTPRSPSAADGFNWDSYEHDDAEEPDSDPTPTPPKDDATDKLWSTVKTLYEKSGKSATIFASMLESMAARLRKEF